MLARLKNALDRLSPRGRLFLFMGLGFVLVLAVWVLLEALDAKAAREAPKPVAWLRMVDPEGKPVHHAEVQIRTPKGQKAPEGASWNASRAEIGLPEVRPGTSLIVFARGHRVTTVDDLARSRDVTLPRGLLVRVRVTGDAPEMDPPLISLLRVRPTEETMTWEEEGLETQTFDLADLMEVMHRPREDALPLPRERWGFAVSDVEATVGFRVPHPGTYVLRWGILDERPGTWFTPQDGEDVVIEVKDLASAQTFDLEVSYGLWNRTRKGLTEWIAQLQQGGAREPPR